MSNRNLIAKNKRRKRYQPGLRRKKLTTIALVLVGLMATSLIFSSLARRPASGTRYEHTETQPQGTNRGPAAVPTTDPKSMPESIPGGPAPQD